MERLQVVASALSKHLGIDVVEAAKWEGLDMKTLYTTFLNSSGKCFPEKDSHEVMQWISFAEGFKVDALSLLDHHLADKSVLLGNGFTPSDADVIVFSIVHSSVIGLSGPVREKWTHVLRWMDYIQRREDFGGLFQKILVEKPDFDFESPLQRLHNLAKSETDSSSKKNMKSMQDTTRSKDDSDVKNNDAKGKSKGSRDCSQEEKKQREAEVVEKDKELSVSLLNIQVGLIRKAWKHPSADSLLVEEIDVGDAKLKQVVSGLAKYYGPDELTNRHVLLITNVKPGKLRDVMSEGLVLCASNQDHTVVEPLLPPQGAKIGERISFPGIDGKPEEVLNPKKKQLEKITPNLFTDDKGVATFKGIPFMASSGPCTSSLTKASIK